MVKQDRVRILDPRRHEVDRFVEELCVAAIDGGHDVRFTAEYCLVERVESYNDRAMTRRESYESRCLSSRSDRLWKKSSRPEVARACEGRRAVRPQLRGGWRELHPARRRSVRGHSYR